MITNNYLNELANTMYEALIKYRCQELSSPRLGPSELAEARQEFDTAMKAYKEAAGVYHENY